MGLPTEQSSAGEEPVDEEPPRRTLSVRPGSSPDGRAEATLDPGAMVGARFQILALIGRGGMGAVYSARDTELGERVALKMLRSDAVVSAESLERFRQEVRLARRVTHPNVARTYDIGDHQTQKYLTMELVEGEPLSAILRRQQKRPFPLRRVEELCRAVCAGLTAAHGAGVVHRDLKPDNVLVSDSGRVVITDFGIARLTQEAGGPEITGGGPMGTPYYMAPEQVQGSAVTPRTDLYALGVMLFEMLTGELPWQAGSAMAVAAARIGAPPPDPRQRVPAMDPRLAALVMGCMALRPEDRPASTEEVAVWLAELVTELVGDEVSRPLMAAPALAGGERAAAPWAATQPASSTPLPPEPTGPGRPRPRRLLLGAVLAVTVGGAAITAAVLTKPAGQPTGQTSGAADGSNAARPARRGLAILGLRSLSNHPDSQWLSTAVSELLQADLLRGGRLRIVPGETMARVKSELRLPAVDSLAPETLKRLREIVGCDLVLGGSYLSHGAAQARRLRLNVIIQDAASGEMVGSISEDGLEADLPGVVSRLGQRLARSLKLGPPTVPGAGTARALPRNPEAWRLYSEGLERLRRYDDLGARALLEKATRAEAGFVAAHSALAVALDRLGHEKSAREAARRAFESSGGLEREERLLVEAQYWEIVGDGERAIELYASLARFFPDNLEYRLKLAQLRSQHPRYARMALDDLTALRQLPGAARDARLDLVESTAAHELSNYSGQLAAAERAAARADASGSPLLRAGAYMEQATALKLLGHVERSREAAEKARQIYVIAGDRLGVARALMSISSASLIAGDLRSGTASLEEAIGIFREIGNSRRLALALNNLAFIELLRGQLGKSLAILDESHRLSKEVGNDSGQVRALVNIASVHVNAGRLGEARRVLASALTRASSLGNRSLLAGVMAREGSLRAAADDLAGARQVLTSAIATLDGLSLAGAAAEARVRLAEVALDEGRPAEAILLAREALGRLSSTSQRASASAVLIQALLAAHRDAEAVELRGVAEKEVEKSDARGVVVSLQLALAELDARRGAQAAARARLEAARREAQQLGLKPLELEARLQLIRRGSKPGQGPATRRQLAEIVDEATALGLKALARRAGQ